MKKIYEVTYILGGITERTDRFDNMTDNSTESAVKAIQDKFDGVWGFDPDAIEVKKIVSGHYERRKLNRLPFAEINAWVAD